jgi:hypothetical protein
VLLRNVNLWCIDITELEIFYMDGWLVKTICDMDRTARLAVKKGGLDAPSHVVPVHDS